MLIEQGKFCHLARTESEYCILSNFLPKIIGLVLALIYLVTLPSGKPGLVLALCSFILVGHDVKRETFGVFCLFFAPIIVGAVFRFFGIWRVGGLLMPFLGFILLGNKSKEILSTKLRLSLCWLLIIEITLIIAYLYGPQTEYCQIKLIRFTYGLLLSWATFWFIFNSRAVNLFDLGLLGVISSVVYYSVCGYCWPEYIPTSIWETCGLRLTTTGQELSFKIPTLGISPTAGFGVISLISGNVNRKFDQHSIILLILGLIIGLIVINSSGQRLWMGIIPIALVSMQFCRPYQKTLWRVVLLFTCLIGLWVTVRGLANNNVYIEKVFRRDSAATILNRKSNWYSAWNRIREKPMFGHGLGGYFVDGYSEPGERTYAHNLFLELLSETGIIGTLAIFLPMLALLQSKKLISRLIYLRTSNGATILPFFIAITTFVMMRSDIQESHIFFAFCALLLNKIGSIGISKDILGFP